MTTLSTQPLLAWRTAETIRQALPDRWPTIRTALNRGTISPALADLVVSRLGGHADAIWANYPVPDHDAAKERAEQRRARDVAYKARTRAVAS